ncbi:MAG: hypothetical protein A2600_10950 [Candidatus Lambdaproteobacteria bacterium RIFOXYD1_FULL_56_27]|uniref:PDZ domain-containing protein n=1 Tax=Candidatus Lambdaproteobacteria bacterium RIFOXYD2_FULL_56_26 TaxID=1817773 RepID=A0A1F6H1S2_9PROT|nr:MAG: hypothetical protein A2557_10695 [Candidatus Lambdaproteobacteria bacterium RIFOXYD2_FULL_56_26]OGH05711.1 MAG: hypothetical protein A2426_04235 [Candidatus Lambdaproteobacteria bacterium RIFOXYC1_FULL_56_13]OGH08422.1 MAG: hypothetical protein A2600_10950 [Candidatus Lambdaproteobacteria bacterium RIFOXYD1_FULL_56_27]
MGQTLKSLLLTLSLCFWAWALVAADLDSELKDLEDFTRALQLVESKGVYHKTHQQLIDDAIEGLLSAQDPYSTLLDAKAFEGIKESSLGKHFGSGMNLESVGQALAIRRVIPGTPAAQAGLKRGMLIAELEGKPVEKVTQEELKGIEKKTGSFRIKLSNGRSLSLTKVWYQTSGVEFLDLGQGTLLVEISEFFVNTPKQLAQELARRQPKRVVLDLRDNPGGLVFSAVEVAELFVPPGMIVETRDKDGNRLETFLARKPPLLQLERFAVLINKNSASAAEILTQALKEREMGMVFGETSFGKGVVQSLFPIGERRYALLTMARYYGPSGESFHGVGIKPDRFVADNLEGDRWGDQDPIFLQAKDWVEGGP